jgi:hypothetical protein
MKNPLDCRRDKIIISKLRGELGGESGDFYPVKNPENKRAQEKIRVINDEE